MRYLWQKFPLRGALYRMGCVVLVLTSLSVQMSAQQEQSIGGKEHEDNVLGVKIGMDVTTALQTIFENSGRKPGQEKPDAKKNEGKDKKDIRVLYKNLAVGEVQIVFADGQRVREILLLYKNQPRTYDLRLPATGYIGGAMRGERYDDRYTVGFTGSDQRERYWWRDAKTAEGYHVRVGFVSGKLTTSGSLQQETIVRKLISVMPGDEEKFSKATASQ